MSAEFLVYGYDENKSSRVWKLAIVPSSYSYLSRTAESLAIDASNWQHQLLVEIFLYKSLLYDMIVLYMYIT